MGRDKALLSLKGETLAERAARILSPLVRQVYLSTSDPSPYVSLGIASVPDAVGRLGPLDGIAGALRLGDVLVLAADLPFVPTALLEHLVAHSGPDGALYDDGRRFEPLAAFYRTSALERALAVLRGDRSMRSFVRDLDLVRLGAEDVEPYGGADEIFWNLNDAAALEEAVRRLGKRADDRS